MTKRTIFFLAILGFFILPGLWVNAETLGYSQIGTHIETVSDNQNWLSGSRIHLPVKSTISKFTAYIFNQKTVIGAIYDSVGDFIIQSNMISANSEWGWRDFDFPTYPTLQSGDYFFLMFPEPIGSTFSGIDVYLSLGFPFTYWYYFSGTYPIFPTHSYLQRDMVRTLSLYITYTPFVAPPSLPANFVSSILSYVGQLIIDFKVLILILVGLTIGFWALQKFIYIFRFKK